MAKSINCCVVALVLLMVNGVRSDHHLKMYELSQNVNEQIPHYPTVEKYHLNVTHNGTRQEGNYWYQIDAISGSSHTGTHVDAPCHFHKGGWCISDIPLENLVAPGVTVDVRDKTRDNADYTVSVDDLQQWEKKYGRIPDGSILLIATGWDRYWTDPIKYLGSADKDPKSLHFPGISHEAAQWLADNRRIVGIGVDTISLDAGQSPIPKAHTILAGRNVYNLENLANLDSLPPTGIIIYALPWKLDGASGAPARVIAVPGDPSHITNSALISVTSLALLIVCLILST